MQGLRPRSPWRTGAAAALVALAALACGSCADKKATALVVAFSSEFSTGNAPGTKREIESISIEYERGGNNNVNPLNVGQGDSVESFPATITYYDDPNDDIDPSTELTLKIDAKIIDPTGNKSLLVNRKVRVTPVEGETRVVSIPLQFACINRGCSSSEVCIGGTCVPELRIEGNSLPSYNEGDIFLPTGSANCFDARIKGCFAGASRVSIASLRADTEDLQVCGFGIAVNGSEQIERLNIGIIWAESNGRYTVLDSDPTEQNKTGWSAKLTGGMTPGSKKTIEVTLPESICREIKTDGTGRVKELVYAFKDGCGNKRPEVSVCGDATEDTLASGLTCAVGVQPKTTIDLNECGACLATQAPAEWAACEQDTVCQAMLGCTFACVSTGGKLEACADKCLKLPSCDPESAARATALASKSAAALIKCGDKCKKTTP